LIKGRGRIGVVADLQIHNGFKVDVVLGESGDSVFLQEFSPERGRAYVICELIRDSVVQVKEDISQRALGGFIPVIEETGVAILSFFRRAGFFFNTLPLSLEHQVGVHGCSPFLIVRSSEDRNEVGELRRHFWKRKFVSKRLRTPPCEKKNLMATHLFATPLVSLLPSFITVSRIA
jgi:hypothetical protein